MTGIITAALLVGGVGLVIGILLSIAAKVFAVKIDENEIAIREIFYIRTAHCLMPLQAQHSWW